MADSTSRSPHRHTLNEQTPCPGFFIYGDLMKGINLYLLQDFDLTLPEAAFMATYAQTFSFEKAYLAFDPKAETEHGRDKLGTLGCQVHHRLKKKIGNKYSKYLDAVGLGLDRIAFELQKGLRAVDKVVNIKTGELESVPNHRVRIKALSLLTDLHGVKSRKLTVENTQLDDLMKSFDRYIDATQEQEPEGKE